MNEEIKCRNCKGRGWLRVDLNGDATTCPTCNGSGDSKNPSAVPVKYVGTYDFGVMKEEDWLELRKEEK